MIKFRFYRISILLRLHQVYHFCINLQRESSVYTYLARMLKWLKWLRIINLLIVALTEYVLYYGFVVPALERSGIRPFFTSELFFLLVLCTLIVTFSGYLINDIVDLEIDRINKPESNNLVRKYGTKSSKTIYWIFVVSGFFVALYIAYFAEMLDRIWMYPLAVVLLYGYAHYFKKTAFLGNLLVALYCAAVVLLMYYIEMRSLQSIEDRSYLIQLFWFYALFAFLTNYLRELIKDAQDMKGDRAGGVKSFPISYGLSKTYLFIKWLLFLLLALLVGWMLCAPFSLSWFHAVYVLLFLIFPCVYLWYGLERRPNVNHRRLHLVLKGLIFAGLINLLFYISF